MRTPAPIRRPPSSSRLDPVVRQPRDVDEQLGRLDAEPHQVDEVRAAGRGTSRPARRPASRPRRAASFGALVAERLQRATVLDRRDDVRVGAAAADVAAHPLADLVRGRASAPRDVARDVARPARVDLVEHPDRRADLAGRAVAALEPSCSTNAACSGCSAVRPPGPRSSTISAPSCVTASARQRVRAPAVDSTVHAPHWPWSQPFFVPVRPRCSRSRSSSDVRVSSSSDCCSPFTRRVTEASSATQDSYPAPGRMNAEADLDHDALCGVPSPSTLGIVGTVGSCSHLVARLVGCVDNGASMAAPHCGVGLEWCRRGGLHLRQPRAPLFAAR